MQARGDDDSSLKKDDSIRSIRDLRVSFREPLMNNSEGLRATPLDYDFMFAVRLPSAVKDKEQEGFERYLKKKYGDGHISGPADLLRKCLLKEKNPANISIDEQKGTNDLKGTLNCIIGLLLSFLESLSSSNSASLDIMKFISVEQNKLFICIRMPNQLAEVLADMAEYPVQLCPDSLEKLGITISDTKDLVPAFVKFDRAMKEKELLVLHETLERPGEKSVIRGPDRIRLIYDKLASSFQLWELQRMLKRFKVTFEFFPAPHEPTLEYLYDKWASPRHFCEFSLPLDEIRNYFGVKITFYFLFVQTMRQGMLVLVLVNVPCSIWWRLTGDNSSRIIAGLFTTVWWMVLVKHWRRTESYYANAWGSDFELLHSNMKEVINPDFRGKPMEAPYDENVKVLQADPRKKKIGQFISYGCSVLFMLLAFGFVLLNRAWAESEKQQHVTHPKAPYVLAVQIFVFSTLWSSFVGPKLTHLEQHAFLDGWNESMSWKTFAVNFFNQFNAFYWVAFAEPIFNDKCRIENCGASLEVQLIKAFPTLLVLTGAGLLTPFLNIAWKYVKQSGDMKKLQSKGNATDHYCISNLEAQTKFTEYMGNDQTHSYTMVLNCLAFVVLFGMLAPAMITLLSFLAISIVMRTDAIRLVTLHRRPFPLRVNGIGVWNSILTFLTYASAINTVALLITNMDFDIAAHIPGFQALVAQLREASAGESGSGGVLLSYLPYLVVFLIAKDVAVFGNVIWDKLVCNQSVSTLREKRRQVHQKIRLFDKELTHFTEKIQMSATSDWETSGFHRESQLRPDDPLFVAPRINLFERQRSY